MGYSPNPRIKTHAILANHRAEWGREANVWGSLLKHLSEDASKARPHTGFGDSDGTELMTFSVIKGFIKRRTAVLNSW